MVDLFIMYYAICLMFCWGYSVLDTLNRKNRKIEIVKVIIYSIIAAPLLPLLWGMREANGDLN